MWFRLVVFAVVALALVGVASAAGALLPTSGCGVPAHGVVKTQGDRPVE